jgi:CheY-like chemotaxis protein
MTSPKRTNGYERAAADGRAFRVLCAEDDLSLAAMLKSALEHAGYSVQCVDDGYKALAQIAADPASFDALITDHQMPTMPGLALISKLRDTPFSGTIIVHSSALTDAEKAAYRALAVDEILSKPVRLSDLLATLKRHHPAA